MQRWCYILLVLFARSVMAGGEQVELFLADWEPGVYVESRTDTRFFRNTGTSGGFTAQLNRFTNQTRYRMLPGHPGSPMFIARWDDVQFNATRPVLPARLVDMGFAAAFPLWKINDHWGLGGAAGVGYASTAVFNDGFGWYGTGSLILVNRISDDSSLIFVLNYDGNRTWWPDVPIPAIAWKHRVDEHLSFLVGAPYNRVDYQLDRFRVSARWLLLTNLDVDFSYDLVDAVSLVGQFRSDTIAGHLADERAGQRMFFDQRRVELGLCYAPTRWTRIELGGGWAFDQQLSRGYAWLDAESYQHIRGTGFVRLSVQLVF